VHRAGHTPRNQFVLSTLLKRQLSRKVYPVHRLDHRTSGAILFAFDSETCGLLHRSLTFDGNDGGGGGCGDGEEGGGGRGTGDEGQKSSQKEYVALLRGDWKRKFGDEPVIVQKPLTVNNITKSAETHFHLLADYTGPKNSIYHPSAFSLVLCKPKTGRTHQIRRHAYSIGFPVLGDSRYGDSKVNRWWRENHGLNRLFLHSFCLDLPSIGSGTTTKRDSVDKDTDTAADSTIAERVDDRINCLAPIPLELSNVLQGEDFIHVWNDAVTKDPRLLKEPYDERGGTFGRHYKQSRTSAESSS